MVAGRLVEVPARQGRVDEARKEVEEGYRVVGEMEGISLRSTLGRRGRRLMRFGGTWRNGGRGLCLEGMKIVGVCSVVE
jgi:hypothetical protein